MDDYYIDCVETYLDDIGAPKEKNVKKLSTVGRIKELLSNLQREMSEVETKYLQEITQLLKQRY